MAVDTVARALALGAGDAASNSYTKSETDTLLSGKADTISADTTIQPSDMYIKGKIKPAT